VVHGAQIQDGQLTAGLDEALVVVPGVVVNNRYNPSLGSRISIRGFGARAAFGVRGIRLIADGIPLTMPDGQSNLNNLDLGSAARIEVLRGPASALHGNAAGGVIAIQSEAPPPGAFSMQARLLAADLDAGDHDLGNFSKLQLKVGGRGARADYLASVSRQEIDGYRAFSASKQTLVNFQGRYAPDDASRLTLVVNAIDQPVAQSPGALPIDSLRRDRRMAWPNNVRTGSGEATWQAQAGLGYGRASEHGRLDLAVYGLGRGLDNALPFGFIELERRAGGARATYSMDGRWLQRAIGFTVGTDLELLSDDRREFDNAGGRPGTTLRRDQIDRVTAVGPFVQGDIDLLPALALTLGARYDAVRFRTTDHFLGDARDDSGERTLTALSPVAGLVFSVRDDNRLYANVATSFQTPTTTELLNAPPAPGQPCCPAGFNEQLEPQRAVSVETGVKGSIGGRLHYDVAAYHMAVRNTLVPFQVSQAEAREFFRNAGESRHRGIEVGAALGVQRLTLTGAYSYSHFVFIDDGLESADFDGNRLPGVPPHHLFVSARLDAGVGIAFETDFDHTSAYFATDANEDAARNPGATVVDVRALLRTRLGAVGARPFVAVNNITNARYNSSVVVNAAAARYYEPAPGRNIAIGVTIGSGGWR
jgi:iron complex outermembrane receptor protein